MLTNEFYHFYKKFQGIFVEIYLNCQKFFNHVFFERIRIFDSKETSN